MEMTDFFISYTGSDKEWAEWIAFILEEAGFTTILQAWDFRPGSNFVLEMQEASSAAERTIMVLSPDYLKSGMAAAEWASAFARDPQGLNRRVVPVMVHNCKPEGLLTAIVQIRIVGMDEVVARQAILNGVDMKRAKPSNRPSFPGAPLAPEHKDFPGVESAPARSVRDLLPRLHATATDADRRRFAKGAFAAIRKTFEDNLKQAAEENDRVDFTSPMPRLRILGPSCISMAPARANAESGSAG
ncbi:toll/interleukin-1 receptor domain-containing protein [Mesorhizobium sp. M8A.F.Ca.ET.165.01.1.1]|nr:toll/interleukin-1 receptor domain-containing protein [Mesorhizobium sp. M8A.F.Ca.ET.207.01.1.1]TGT36374.1 toll/interleukin-1 receptor domain-containing protein [Mesorhizobium sp. M8A.F.Ca.ET.165.01.1.1]